jgi:hypothetical protein
MHWVDLDKWTGVPNSLHLPRCQPLQLRERPRLPRWIEEPLNSLVPFGLGIANGQKPTLGGERWFRCARSAQEDAGAEMTGADSISPRRAMRRSIRPKRAVSKSASGCAGGRGAGKLGSVGFGPGRSQIASTSTHFPRSARPGVSPRSRPRSARRKAGSVGSSRWKWAEVSMASSPRVRTRSSTWPRSGSGSGPRHVQAAGEIRQAEARQRALTSSKWKTGWVFATSASSTNRDRTISKSQADTSGLRRSGANRTRRRWPRRSGEGPSLGW